MLFILSVLLAVTASSPAFAGAKSIYVPIEETLWRVSSDGKAEKVDFSFPEASIPGSTEAKLSPDRKAIAFTRWGNAWMVNLANFECREITNFPDPHVDWSSTQNIGIYGWTKDQRHLAAFIGVAEWGPGEGEAPPKETELHGCKSVLRRQSRAPLVDSDEDSTNPETNQRGDYRVDVESGTLSFVGEEGEATKDIYPDGVYVSVVPSPDGKRSAQIRDPYQGKSELIVDDKNALPGIRVREFWWIDNNAIAAVCYSTTDKKEWELRIVQIPSLKAFGPFLKPFRSH